MEKETGEIINSSQTIIIYLFSHDKFNKYTTAKSCINFYAPKNDKDRLFRKKEYKYFGFTVKGNPCDKYKLHEDRIDYIRNSYFVNNGGCGNYIIIKPDGSYYRMLGEHRRDEMREKVKKGW